MYCAEEKSASAVQSRFSSVEPNVGNLAPKARMPDESKDELAIRLRTEGLTFREIGAAMGVDAAMAHRRVKRAMMRRRCEMEDRLEDIRDLEFEKLRVAERALMPQVAEGDQGAIRLLLRIIEARKRYLKELPYKNVAKDPWAELMDDAKLNGPEEDDPFVDEGEPDNDAEIDEETTPSATPDAQASEPNNEQALATAIADEEEMLDVLRRTVAIDDALAPGTLMGEHARATIAQRECNLQLMKQKAASTKGSTPGQQTQQTSPRKGATPRRERKGGVEKDEG